MATVEQPSVERLLRDVEDLSRDDQLRLLEELTRLVSESTKPLGPATALRGAGRELWDGTDAQEYVNRERDSWGG